MPHPDRFLLAGVMGDPVMHSRSPELHGYWFEKYGLTGSYLPLAIKPAGLRAALRALPPLGFSGCNLTIPHKEAALAIVDTRRSGGEAHRRHELRGGQRPTAPLPASTTTPSATSRACARRSLAGAPMPARSS